ncbi:uncharacterized protein B0I36DRAFT_308994 [Microdochium trichocladiopsis]|uniref:Uncharacterized protein n=1 Tax=Microdochium trichocladiopsis TaxID=1682393 RepID=A0A9P9BVJ4_9PEZI|nr:uncharacterized protein B0I36DRAFT_308994 [Microdochium trichocladiopsis]KAH7039630.1 hypothetical protein B0I36DRAFT_308994 [Microdochium trichocladiopsis]
MYLFLVLHVVLDAWTSFPGQPVVDERQYSPRESTGAGSRTRSYYYGLERRCRAISSSDSRGVTPANVRKKVYVTPASWTRYRSTGPATSTASLLVIVVVAIGSNLGAIGTRLWCVGNVKLTLAGLLDLVFTIVVACVSFLFVVLLGDVFLVDIFVFTALLIVNYGYRLVRLGSRFSLLLGRRWVNCVGMRSAGVCISGRDDQTEPAPS